MQEGQTVNDRAKLVWLGIAACVAILLTMFYQDILSSIAPRIAHTGDAQIPASFSGNRAAYGFAFFSLSTVSLLSMRKLLILILQFRTERWRDAPDIAMYRLAIGLFCVAFLLGAAPDVIVLLLWGEASPAVMNTVRMVDRIGDSLVVFAAAGGFTVVLRAETLSRVPPGGSEIPPRTTFFEIVPRRESMHDHVVILAAIGTIAAGLALYK